MKKFQRIIIGVLLAGCAVVWGGTLPAQALPPVSSSVAVGDAPFWAVFSLDESKLYVTNFDSNSVSVMDTSTDTVIATIPVGSSPAGLALSPDGSKIYVANYDGGTITVITTATDTVTATIPIGGSPIAIEFIPDGTAYVTSVWSTFPPAEGQITVIDSALDQVETVIPWASNQPFWLDSSPDGSFVYVTDDQENTLTKISTVDNQVVESIAVGNTPEGMAVSPDGAKAYVSNYDDGTVTVVNLDTFTATETITVGAYPVGVTFTADGLKAYVVNMESLSVSIIDTQTDTVIQTLYVGGIEPDSIALTSDGVKAYITNYGGTTVTVLAATPEPPVVDPELANTGVHDGAFTLVGVVAFTGGLVCIVLSRRYIRTRGVLVTTRR